MSLHVTLFLSRPDWLLELPQLFSSDLVEQLGKSTKVVEDYANWAKKVSPSGPPRCPVPCCRRWPSCGRSRPQAATIRSPAPSLSSATLCSWWEGCNPIALSATTPSFQVHDSGPLFCSDLVVRWETSGRLQRLSLHAVSYFRDRRSLLAL